MRKGDLIEIAKKMIAAPSCYSGLKVITQNWLDAIGTAEEKTAARKLVEELEMDITEIDALVTFAHSEHAAEVFGADGAKDFAAHADALKAGGAKWCDCEACTNAFEILKNKALIID